MSNEEECQLCFKKTYINEYDYYYSSFFNKEETVFICNPCFRKRDDMNFLQDCIKLQEAKINQVYGRILDLQKRVLKRKDEHQQI